MGCGEHGAGDCVMFGECPCQCDDPDEISNEERIRADEREALISILTLLPFAEGTHTGTRQLDLKRRAIEAFRARGVTRHGKTD